MRETPDDPEGAPPLASSPRSHQQERNGGDGSPPLTGSRRGSGASARGGVRACAAGRTSIAVLRDERTVGLVLEGWAFDPNGSTDAVISAVASPGARVRTLQP